MNTTLIAFGDSLGVAIPASLVKRLELNIGDKLKVSSINGSIVMTPIKRKKYKLDDLLAQCDLTAPFPQESFDWEGVDSTENEII